MFSSGVVNEVSRSVAGSKRLKLKTGKSGKHKKIKRIQVGRMKTKLRKASENSVKLKSLR